MQQGDDADAARGRREIEWIRPLAVRAVALGAACVVVGPLVGALGADVPAQHVEVAALPPHFGAHEPHTPSSTESVIVEAAPAAHYAIASTNAVGLTSWSSTSL